MDLKRSFKVEIIPSSVTFQRRSYASSAYIPVKAYHNRSIEMHRILQTLGYRKTMETRIEIDPSLRHIDERYLVWWVHPVLPRLPARVN